MLPLLPLTEPQLDALVRKAFDGTVIKTADAVPEWVPSLLSGMLINAGYLPTKPRLYDATAAYLRYARNRVTNAAPRYLT